MSLESICSTGAAGTAQGAVCPQRDPIQSPWGNLLVNADRYLTANIQARFPSSSIGPGFDPRPRRGQGQTVPRGDSATPSKSTVRASAAPSLVVMALLGAGALILILKR